MAILMSIVNSHTTLRALSVRRSPTGASGTKLTKVSMELLCTYNGVTFSGCTHYALWLHPRTPRGRRRPGSLKPSGTRTWYVKYLYESISNSSKVGIKRVVLFEGRELEINK